MKRDSLPGADTAAVAAVATVATVATEIRAATPALVHRPAGIHVLADLSGIDAEKLRSCETLERLLRAAAEAARARVLHSHFHGFGEGQGVTGVVLLAESHISIHTWPEFGFAAADIFMCGDARPELALAIIEQALAPSSSHVNTVRRAPPGF